MARKNQKKPKSRGSRPLPLPVLWTDMLAASMETIARRSLLIATGNFTLTEYQRMVCEKAKALQGTALAAATGTPTPEALLAPWHRIAKANAKRLRRAQS
ncbi:hypothetical protein [Aquibaculum arenosum]|uniref:Uncharacterized protein n=1 Tax=Aquibaculum arenosum TaxID=3032591 RepID=A0ABT5YK04_9PROT|nr:hypothetical protein [Fodinicurvata sp. CAU 1616]MDF2095202.1 hypothetical protein [Fodinicurvata sp. CAU 1616]